MLRRTLLCVLLPALPALGAPDDWPRWRGPFDTGMARGDAPLRWSDSENVAWKTPIPGRGFSSPVIWGDRLFLTTAVPERAPEAPEPARRGPGGGVAAGVPHRFLVMAIDRKSGRVLWERVAISAAPHEGYHHRYGSFASNSPVTDGNLLYAFFGSRGVYAYSLDGRLAWSREFPPMRMRNAFGEGTAPVLDGDRLILGFDQEENSYLLVLDKRTGNEIWRVDRDEVSAWSPPLVTEVSGKKQIIVSATRRVRAYDYDTGKVIWETAGLGTNVIPAPVVFQNVVVVMSGHRDPNLLAIRLGRSGDLTGSDAILWTNQRGNSYTPSPVMHEGKIYFVTDSGLVNCFDVLTGEAHYRQQRLPQPYNFKASPVGAGGKLYLATEQGDVVVLKLGTAFEVLATNTLSGQMFIASPAVAEGDLYLRGQNTLFCIREGGR
jgi:outer membrane protein assembly factor BamB